jgi:hypothetical protein
MEPFRSVKFGIVYKGLQLGKQKVPFHYIINKQHIFEIDITANVTLVNLGFSSKNVKFNFVQNDYNF